MFDEQGLRDDHGRILKEIQVLRRPCVGIVSGYHELGYRVLGPEAKQASGSVQISGRLMVSPKLIWTPAQAQKTFGELFEEREIMDANLVGRVFAFPAVGPGAFSLRSEYVKVTRHEWSPDVLIEKVLDELLRQEETGTAVLRTPDIRYYPLAVQRFIHEILSEEFA
jgi:hypothetical protein